MIRHERSEDDKAVRRVIGEAFGTPLEANLVELLRVAATPQISLVADLNGKVVGHIFFGPVQVESTDGSFTAMGLGPVAVFIPLP